MIRMMMIQTMAIKPYPTVYIYTELGKIITVHLTSPWEIMSPTLIYNMY